MKKFKIVAAVALLSILAMVVVNYNLLSTAEDETKPATIVLEKDMSLPLGSVGNPFVILEIVPHESMAEIGYMIPGCEPIDMDALALNEGLMGGFKTKFMNSNPSVMDLGEDICTYKMPDEIVAGDTVTEIDGNKYGKDLNVNWSDGKSLINSEGVNVQSGNYGVWVKTSPWPAKTFTGYYVKVEEGTGHFNLVTNNGEFSFEFVGLNQGNYRWVTEENVQNIETDYSAEKVWTERTPAVYYTYKKYNIIHNDDMITTIFDAPSEEIEKQVITVTPYDFTNPDNIELIYQVDMIYIHRAHDTDAIFRLWESLNKEGETFKDKNGNAITRSEAAKITFEDNDLPWDAAVAIVKRMAEEDPAALIMDSAVVGNIDVANDNNCHKLAIMLRQYGPKIFDEVYLQTGKVVESEEVKADGLTTGVYVKDKDTAIKAWDKTTFYPDIPDKSTNNLIEYGMKDPYFTSSWITISDNIYINSGDKVMLDDFLSYEVKESDANGEAFDYYEDLYGTRPEKLNANEIIKFLLQDVSKKRNLKILEVQPCNEFIYGSEGWETYYLSMLTWFEGDLKKDVEVVTMPTWEFNSSIEDLNSEYDLIIMGVKQNASNGANGYHDTLLHGKDAWGNDSGWLAYTSIGDIVTTSAKKDTTGAQTLVADTSMRYSGTDITRKKFEELKAYMNAGKPIVLDRSCLSREWGNTGTNTKLIDISSNMYQLVSMYNNEVEGVDTGKLFVRGLYQANKLKRVLAYETCKIKFDTSAGTGYPTEYQYDPASDGTITNVTYSPTREFEYRFKIVGKTGQKYGISLFIDMNGDGVYEGSLKETDHAEALANGKSEMVTGIVVKDRLGNVVKSNELYANMTYTVKKELEDTYQGILPWKLEAYKADNENCRNSVVKYSAVKSSDGEKEKIRVLLMDLTPDMSSPEEYYGRYGDIRYVLNESAFIKMNEMEQFQRYISCVDEYDITLDFMENKDWMEKFDPDTKGFDSSAITTQASNISMWKQYLDEYDMLILGFNDDCTYTNNYIYNEGFKYFANQGKSIILSHDMIRDNSQNQVLRTNFDEQLRQMLGQRRFYTDSMMMNGYEISLLGNNTKNYAVTAEDGTQIPGVVDNSTRQYIVFDKDGMSDRDTAFTGTWGTGEGVTTYVNVINQGQITNYPYKIAEVIPVASTHAQNFQLNLEDEDVVVWYGLTDKYSSKVDARNEQKYYEENPGTDKEYVSSIAADKLDRGIYSSIESDGRNSFYIYNKGNITYTGLGHRGNMTDEEVQLFVNTMIAAYRATAATPKIKITNEDAIVNGDEVTLYIPLDDSNFDTSGENLDVYFKVSDSSLVAIANRTYVLTYKDKNGNVIAEVTYKKDTNGVVTANSNNTVFVERDGEYYFKVPYSKVRSEGIATYQLTLTSSYVNADSATISTEATTTVHVMPMPLFTLN